MESILDKLHALSDSDFYPYHMPGHKRCGSPYFALDITEIDGFDNLHHATDILKEAQERAARLYGAKDSFYLVNGSTCGLLTAVFASFRRGDKVLVARNCHKAVYHALELRGIEPVYIYPELDVEYDINVGITVEQVALTLKTLDADKSDRISNKVACCDGKSESKFPDGRIKGMILTSPTYEGLVSEIKEIADYLHSRDMVLIVDEAHGAHFGFHKGFSESAVTQGADLVIQSLHKTLPSMTQTALLHRCSERVDLAKIKKYSGVFQTSSPSYVMMAYMDECIRLLEKDGTQLFDTFVKRLETFYKRCESFECISVRKPEDPGKIVISAGKYLSGKDLYEILRSRYHLQPEMYSGSYVLAIMTICDTKEGFDRLYEALEKLDAQLGEKTDIEIHLSQAQDTKETLLSLIEQRPVVGYLAGDVENMDGEKIKLTDAAGRVSKEYIYLYPPGIPFIVPGEIISEEMAACFRNLQSLGYELQGMSDESGESIQVVCVTEDDK